ncbi:hypothetical protein C9J12_29790 [Photobacterium frigidiphilum]|uniref:Uncharacterized protein n=1 Tax=Photobacterium frigidiphilum TaxID=264736 RepID=A0A2T3J5M3_9GAMM|nr:hypothetical protein [Photobacterium frigidiphilum]PSU40838.1 hypothetical protein C9J12_29790 [Photobacterium frigidiphilum]
MNVLFKAARCAVFFIGRNKKHGGMRYSSFLYSTLSWFCQLNGEGLLMIVRLAYMPRAVLNNVYRVSRSLLLASF